MPTDYNKMFDIYALKNLFVVPLPKIVKVIYNEPATIILWDDQSKTVVTCGEGDIYDPEKGLAMAVAKKYFGNKGRYYEQFKKWLPERDPNE